MSDRDVPSTSAASQPAVAGSGLLARLHERPWEFDFFQAVWLFERYLSGETLIGQRGPVARERLRFRPDVSLGFPSTDVRALSECRHPGSRDTFALLEVAFLGLYGVSTPMPLHYAVDVLRAVDTDISGAAPAAAGPPGTAPTRSPMRDFIDIFNHRAISLFYRAWLKYRYERMFTVPQRDVVSEYLRLLLGCPLAYTEALLDISPVRLLRYLGALTQRPRSAMTLEGVLFDFWGDIPVRITQFVGKWVPLEAADLNRIGQLNSGLGVDLTVGEEVYDLGGSFTIALGPVNWETYLTLVPGGYRYRQTRALARLYCCDPLAFTLEVTLAAGEVPETRLTSDDGAGALGLTSWVRTGDLGPTAVSFAASEESSVALGATPCGAAEATRMHTTSRKTEGERVGSLA